MRLVFTSSCCLPPPGLYKIFDEILVNAADNKVRDPKMDTLKVDIDAVSPLPQHPISCTLPNRPHSFYPWLH